LLQREQFALLPLKPGDKVPDPELLPTNKSGYATWTPLSERAASDAEVERWFKEKPNINVGLICGPVAGLYVLDVDKKPPADIGELPPTVTVKTGRGWHYYFKSNKTIKTFTMGKWGSLQGVGSYVVAAGSVHPGGAIYEYADTMGINEIEIADLPEWLADGRRRKKHVFMGESARAPAPTTSLFKSPPISEIKDWHTNNTVSMPCIEFSTYEELNQAPAVAFKVLELCGRKVDRIGRAFCCPIPGHNEKKPSAALWQRPGRPIVLHDLHKVDPDREWWPLVDVYASVVVGRALHLRRGERAIWWLRALHQIGEINPPIAQRYELPAKATQEAQLVYDGFCYLLELQQLYQVKSTAPYNRKFAAKWCATDIDVIRRGMTWLLGRGYLFVAERGRPNTADEGPALTFFAIGRPKEVKR
jgi:hypothetical protein